MLRRAAVAGVLAVIVLSAGAGVLARQAAGPPPPGAQTRGDDALWLGHAWVDGRRTPADASSLGARLRGTGIRALYLHVGPLDDSGRLDPALRPRAATLVRALHQALPGVRALAWVGGVAGRGRLDLSRPTVRAAVVAAGGQVLGDGFDGVQLDIEPVSSGDRDFLALLDDARVAIGRQGGMLAVATSRVEPVPGLGGLADALPTGPSLWSPSYLAAVAARADQVVVMAYDTGLPLESLYAGSVARQTRLALRAVPPGTELLIGVPAFHDENAGHHSWAETVSAAIRGVRAGLDGDPHRQRFGVALYVDFAATGADWRAYRDGWVRASAGPPRPARR